MRFSTLLVLCGLALLLRVVMPAQAKAQDSPNAPPTAPTRTAGPAANPAPPRASNSSESPADAVAPASAGEPVETVSGAKRLRLATSSTVVEASSLPLSPTSVRITPEMIDTAAGAFEDPARYFQLLPGVSSQSDQRNDFVVRGGNPSENLFVIDNIDVHSISHLALSDTTGGFVSMIDNAAVQSMTLHTGGHDAKFDDRLSSVVEISTVPDQTPGSRLAVRHMMEAGIAGVGGLDSRPFGGHGSLFVSAREGILRYVTNDIGMNGVPRYNNSLVRGDTTFSNGDKVWGMALTGMDSIVIHPDQSDPDETNPIDVRYSGWRNTTGINWQHGFSARSFGVFTLSNSEQAQTVVENAQQAGGQDNQAIYNEQTHNGDTSLKTQFTLQATERLTLSAGATETLTRLDYNIVQPAGVAMNPYDADPAGSTATNIHRSFATGQDAGYAQAAATLPGNLRLTLAARAQHWSLGGNLAVTPKASLSVPLGRQRTLSLGCAEYAQMPAYLYMLSFPQNESLKPIRARHLTAAATLVDRGRVRIALAAYRKTYRDYPVSTQFPQLSLANVGDTFGEAFLLFPMTSSGLGQAAGAELSVDVRPTSRLMLTANLAFSRSRFSGLDGILRNGSSDLPLVGNLAAVMQLRHGLVASMRYTGTSGRPYTPDNLPQSMLQDRDVYDVTQIDGRRGPSYGRLDFRIQRSKRVRSGELLWHIGLDNALDKKNFYEYQWEPNEHKVTQQDQMPLFPDGGVKYTF